MELETEQLILRPVTDSDSDAIAEVIFSDPNVVTMLAHNTCLPEDALREAERWTKNMGVESSIWGEGGLGLFAVTPKIEKNTLAGVAGFYMEKNADGLRDGEYFYALGSKWHGRRFMSEAAVAFKSKLANLPNLGTIYATYWDITNDVSGRVLQKTGFVPMGRKLLLDEYDEVRCERMFEYDLWRLQIATSQENRELIVAHTARRAGAFVAENVLETDYAITQLERSYGSPELPKSVVDIFYEAISLPGLANFEYRS